MVLGVTWLFCFISYLVVSNWLLFCFGRNAAGAGPGWTVEMCWGCVSQVFGFCYHYRG